MQLESIVLLPQLLSPPPTITSQGAGWEMPQLPGTNSPAPGWGAGWLLRHSRWRGGRGWEKRNISLPDPEQPGAGVHLAVPRGQFPSSDSAGLCSSLLASSSSGQPSCTSYGEQTACPKPCDWKPLLQGREAPGSFFAQG